MGKMVSIVIPVYQSEPTLIELCQRINCVMTQLDMDYELIMVDDGSTDRSFQQLMVLHQKDSRIKAIRFAGNFGQQNALMCGFRYAAGDLIVTIDDDLQHPPEEIPKLIDALQEQQAEVVFGIPIQKQHSAPRNFGSKLVSLVLNLITAKPPGLQVSSFRAITRRVIDEIIREERAFIYLAPIIFRVTGKLLNVQVEHRPRQNGRSNYNYSRLVCLVIKLILNYSVVFHWIPRRRKPQYIIEQTLL